MNYRLILAAYAASQVGACATVEQHPQKRPLSEANMSTLGDTRVVVSANNYGVQKSWFYTDNSAAGAQYGLLGALVTSTMDAIINSGPSRNARKAANEVAEVTNTDALDVSLRSHLEGQKPQAEPPVAQVASLAAVDGVVVPATTTAAPAIQPVSYTEAAPTAVQSVESVITAPLPSAIAAAPAGVVTVQKVRISEVAVAQKLLAPDAVDDAVEVSVSYTLSEDASALKVSAFASYKNAAINYATLYTFKASAPKGELEGPLYRNSFTYESARLPVPVLTPELKERLVASIKASYIDASGALPAEGTDEFRKMNRELVDASDDRLSKPEAAIFLVREWVKDNGAPLKLEIEKAHAFIAKYLVIDLNNPAVPSLTGSDIVLEELADKRTVRELGTGTMAGSYVSSPGGVVEFTSYGNAVSAAEVVNDKVKALRAQAKEEKQSKKPQA